jgi:hypothetical protein
MSRKSVENLTQEMGKLGGTRFVSFLTFSIAILSKFIEIVNKTFSNFYTLFFVTISRFSGLLYSRILRRANK